MAQCCHGRANYGSHTLRWLSCFLMCRHPRFSFGARMGQCKITPVPNKVKEQLVYLNFAALTVGRVIRFEALPLHPHILVWGLLISGADCEMGTFFMGC